MRYDDNLTTERPTFVTHLECSATGERYPADALHNLSRAGKPLLVRYDLAGVRQAMTKDALAERPQDLWRYRELLPVRRARRHRQPRRGRDAAAPAAQARQGARRRRDPRQGRRPPADRLVQGARPGDGGVDGQGARHHAHGDADQRQCRRGARRLCEPLRHPHHDLLSRRHAGGERQRDRAAGRQRLSRQRPDRRLRQAGRAKARRRSAGSTSRR